MEPMIGELLAEIAFWRTLVAIAFSAGILFNCWKLYKARNPVKALQYAVWIICLLMVLLKN